MPYLKTNVLYFLGKAAKESLKGKPFVFPGDLLDKIGRCEGYASRLSVYYPSWPGLNEHLTKNGVYVVVYKMQSRRRFFGFVSKVQHLVLNLAIASSYYRLRYWPHSEDFKKIFLKDVKPNIILPPQPPQPAQQSKIQF